MGNKPTIDYQLTAESKKILEDLFVFTSKTPFEDTRTYLRADFMSWISILADRGDYLSENLTRFYFKRIIDYLSLYAGKKYEFYLEKFKMPELPPQRV